MNISVKKVILPINQDEWEKMSPSHDDFSLTTSLSLAAGAVLNYLEKNGPSKLWEISFQIGEWPAVILIMSVGALARERLIHVRKRHRGIALELVRNEHNQTLKKHTHVPFFSP